MEVLQIEGVILHLFPCGGVESRRADFELKYKNGTFGYQHCIQPAPKSQQRVFKQQSPLMGQVTEY